MHEMEERCKRWFPTTRKCCVYIVNKIVLYKYDNQLHTTELKEAQRCTIVQIQVHLINTRQYFAVTRCLNEAIKVLEKSLNNSIGFLKLPIKSTIWLIISIVLQSLSHTAYVYIIHYTIPTIYYLITLNYNTIKV